MSNIYALPIAQMTVVTVNNEDWVESMKFVVPPEGVVSPDDMPQLDLRGMWFEMYVRRSPNEHEVVLSASRDDGRLLIGSYPDYGYLILRVPVDAMKKILSGAYVADIVAFDGVNVRTICQIDLTIQEGITR